MPKVKLSDIFKNGDDFQLKKINFDDSNFKKACKACKKEQERIAKRKIVDWVHLDKIYINI